jgi:LCP family protein required for cell wall assembly
MEENNNLEQDEGKETSLADEGISIQEESVETHSAEEEAVLENDAETEDSAVSKTEEKNTDIEESGEVVVKEESEEVKEAEVIEEEKGSDEKEYAEVIEETKVSEEITEEAELEVTEEDTVSDVTDKTENACETVEPEVEPEKEVSKDSAEDADIIEKESTTNTVEEPQNLSNSSAKPQAVLDELDKLKSENTADEVVKEEKEEKEEKKEESVPSEDSSKTEEVISDSKGANLSEKQDLSEEKSKKETLEKQSDSQKDEKAEESKVEEQEDDSSSEGFLLFTQSYNKDFWKSFFFDLFFFCLCACFTFVLIQKWFSTREVIIQGTNQVHGSLESGEKTTIGNINILVMGIDSVEGTHRSDTIFVLGVNPSKKKIMMLSIPRDTRVLIEDKGRKINEILPRYGEPTLRKILEDLLKIKISRKVEIGFESFISVVDAIGGVDINIEKPMHYDDNWGNLHIHFNPGMNHLNGQDAL